MIVIGTGNVGMLLATMFDKEPLLLSTAHQDTINFKNNFVHTFSEEGAGKNFRIGLQIWQNNYEKLQEIFEYVVNEKVVIFSALGGGSGSSSLNLISKILLEQNNKVLIIAILPYKKEINPPLANSVQAINLLLPLLPKVSIMLFDNNGLRRDFSNNWLSVNEYIVHKVDYLLNLLINHSIDEYSPITLDQSELDSVVFGGGFVDYSDTFLEERGPRFEYGSLDKSTKNCLMVMYIDSRIKNMKKIYDYQSLFMELSSKIATRVANARFIPGIIRSEIAFSNSTEGVKDRAYIIIASGLNIDRYFKKLSKIRDIAIEKASIYIEIQKSSKLIDSKENKVLDI